MKAPFLVVELLLLVSLTVGQRAPESDGRWWLSKGNDERVEFLAGYLDCYVNNFGDTKTFTESWYTYEQRITRYYQQNPHGVARHVTSVLFDVRSENPPKPHKDGEVWIEKRGFFNGEYWREIGTTQRTAFIEGYLACHREHLSSRPEHFSKSATIYEEQISHRLGIDAADPSDINSKLEDVAIADVLYKFADFQK